jgi:5-formyltetrahydrofolate cyclo-ligase
VQQHLFAAFEFADFAGDRQVALYAALPGEVPTRPLFDALIRVGVRCCFPRVTAVGGLEFAPVARWSELVAADFGVLAPDPGAPAVSLGDCDLVLVPGLAFDRRGVRLGRGKGCYDRAFPPGSAPGTPLCGVAYEVQLEESVPATSHDRAMDAIVTEHRFRWTRGDPR